METFIKNRTSGKQKLPNFELKDIQFDISKGLLCSYASRENCSQSEFSKFHVHGELYKFHYQHGRALEHVRMLLEKQQFFSKL